MLSQDQRAAYLEKSTIPQRRAARRSVRYGLRQRTHILLQRRMKLLSATQTSKLLGLDRSRIKALCAQGRIKGAVKVGEAWVIPSPPVVLPPPKRA